MEEKVKWFEKLLQKIFYWYVNVTKFRCINYLVLDNVIEFIPNITFIQLEIKIWFNI